MVLNKFGDGTGGTNGPSIKSSPVNRNFAFGITQTGINLIRQLLDRSIAFSEGEIEGWAEAYVDSGGQKNSVDDSQTTAIHDSSDEIYIPSLSDEASGDTTHDPDGFTSPGSAFDGDDATNASISISDTGQSVFLGKTFGAKTVRVIRVVAQTNVTGGTNNIDSRIRIQTFDGVSWTSVTTLADGPASQSFDGYYVLDSSVEGIRIQFAYYNDQGNWDATPRLFTLEYGDPADGLIYHDLPTGTFNSTISSAIGVPMLADWETDANVQYKLTNTGGDDSGWLDAMNTKPEISSFTAFSNGEPDTLIVKLVPKSSSPATETPSIRGFYVMAE